MTRPLVGITMYGRDDSDRVSLPTEYVDSVRRAGAAVVLLPAGELDNEVIFERLDAVVFGGGGDIDPACYDGAPHAANYMLDPQRDRGEIDLARLAIDAGKPTLGICRGTQIINIARGGALHAHVPEVFGESIAHRRTDERALPGAPNPTTWTLHDVAIDRGTRVFDLVGAEKCTPASWHHQAIDRVGDDLVVTARADDGVIEAIELPDHPFCVAVQWHPEITAADDPVQQRLFNRFIEILRSE